MLAIETVRPMLLDERKEVPPDEDAYVAEPKFDGYRVIGQFGDGQCQLRSRNGADCSRWFQEVADALGAAQCGRMIVDGEMCVLDASGRSDFEALHARARRRRYMEGTEPVTFCVFDLLVENGLDLTQEPLLARKGALQRLWGFIAPAHTLYVQHISGDDIPHPITWLFQQALQHQLEGIIGKREDSIYEPGIRSKSWFKLKRPGAVPPKRFKR